MQQKRGIQQYRKGFNLTLAEERLRDPYRWRTPKLVFVNSMSDLFHEDVPLDYLKSIFSVMQLTPHHTYQILTKRISRLEKISGLLPWENNIWIGVSVESNKWTSRIKALKRLPAKVKFVSFEPLLGAINDLDLGGIQWVIVGGETGGNARLLKKEWVIKIQRACTLENIPFFFKQWGKRAFNPDPFDPTLDKEHQHYSKGGCLLDGKLYRNIPFN